MTNQVSYRLCSEEQETISNIVTSAISDNLGFTSRCGLKLWCGKHFVFGIDLEPL